MVSFFKSIGIASFVVAAADAASYKVRQNYEDVSGPNSAAQMDKPSNGSFISFYNKVDGANGGKIRTSLPTNSSTSVSSSALKAGYPNVGGNTTITSNQKSSTVNHPALKTGQSDPKPNPNRNGSTSVHPVLSINYPNTTIASVKNTSTSRQPALSTIYPNATVVPHKNSSASAQPVLSTIYPNNTLSAQPKLNATVYKNLTSTVWSTYCPSCVESSPETQSSSEKASVSHTPISVVNVYTTATYTTIATITSCPGVSTPCQTSTVILETTSTISAGVPGASVVPGAPEYTAVPISAVTPPPAPPAPTPVPEIVVSPSSVAPAPAQEAPVSTSQEATNSPVPTSGCPESSTEVPIEPASPASTTETPAEIPAPTSSAPAVVSTGGANHLISNKFAAAAFVVAIAII